MTHGDDGSRARRFRAFLMAAGKVTALVAALALATHVSWNMFAPDLFGLPQIRMKQALGLVTFAAVVSVLLRFPAARRGHG